MGKRILQLGALKYRDLKFEGRSLGSCTDVYVAVGVRWMDKLYGFCVAFYNDNKQVIKIVNRNWFFAKKYATTDWERTQNNLSVYVTHNCKPLLGFGSKILTHLLIFPNLQRVRPALTVSGDDVYAFDNHFEKRFGIYSRPTVQAQGVLEWLANLQKRRFYSIQWFNDVLRITDAKPVAKLEGAHL